MAKVCKIILFFLLIIGPLFVSAATLSITPSSGTYEIGDIITIRAIVSGYVSLNAISSPVLISPTFVTIQSVSKASSIIDFWITEPAIDRTSGVINFEGVALSGFQGSSGIIATIKLKAVKIGTGRILFQSGQILANDGEGTDITGNLSDATFTIIEATKKIPEEEPVEIETPQPLPSLKAPEIMSGTKYGIPSIIGSSDYPDAQVVLTFTAQDGTKVFITGSANGDGSFNLTIPNSLKRGQYGVNAVMVKKDKTSSEKSNLIIIKVGTIFSDISREIFWLLILLILTVIYLLVRTFQHFSKDRTSRKRLKHEVREAEEIARKSFNLLRDDIAYYGKEKSPTSRQAIVSEIKKDINNAEKVVEKEIKDIESV